MKNGWEIKPLGWVAIIAVIGIAVYFTAKAFDDKKRKQQYE